MALGKLVAEAMINTEKARQSLAELEAAMKRVGDTGKKIPPDPLGGFGQNAAVANMWMTQFAFTIQDTPYFLTNLRMGIMSVSNNLGFLVSQFGQLKQAAGANGSVFKMLLGTLKGPGGLILGFSAAIAAVQALSMAFDGANKSASDLADEGMEKLKNQLKGMDAIDLAAVKERADLAAKELEKQMMPTAKRLASGRSALAGTILALAPDSWIYGEEAARTLEILRNISEEAGAQIEGQKRMNAAAKVGAQLLGTQRDEYDKMGARVKEIDEELKKEGLGAARSVLVQERADLQEKMDRMTETSKQKEKRLEREREEAAKKRKEAAEKELSLIEARVKVGESERQVLIDYMLMKAQTAKTQEEEYDWWVKLLPEVEAYAEELQKAADASADETEKTKERTKTWNENQILIRQINAEMITDARARATELHKVNMARIALETNAEIRAAREAEERHRYRVEMSRIEADEVSRLADVVAQTGAVMSSAFQGAQDEAIRKFAAMLQMLAQMIKAAQQFADALKIDSPLDILGAVLSFFGGFAGIGAIFGKPVTGGGAEVEATTAGMYRPPVVSLAGGGSSEIRALRRSMEGMTFSPTIVFRNVLDAQKIVREELPGAEKWNTRKRVS